MQSQINVLYPLPAYEASAPVTSQATVVSTAAVSPTGYTSDTGGGGVALVTLDIQVSNLRVRWDGVAPTATVGHLLFAGTNYTWSVSMYNAAKFIRDTAASVDGTVFASPLSN